MATVERGRETYVRLADAENGVRACVRACVRLYTLETLERGGEERRNEARTDVGTLWSGYVGRAWHAGCWCRSRARLGQ